MATVQEGADFPARTFAVEWLEGIQLGRSVDVLLQNAIETKDDLLSLTEGDVRELFPQIGPRNRVLNALLKLHGIQPGAGRSGLPSYNIPKRASLDKAPAKVEKTSLQPRSSTRSPSKPQRIAPSAKERRVVPLNPPPPSKANSARSQSPLSTLTKLDRRYLKDREQKAREREAKRKEMHRQEHEQLVDLLKRTVYHPSHGPSPQALKQRDDMMKREMEKRRSLSPAARRRSPSVGSTPRSPSAARRTKTPPCTPSASESYVQLSKAYKSLKEDAPSATRSSSPNTRRRVWSRGNEPLLTSPPPASILQAAEGAGCALPSPAPTATEAKATTPTQRRSASAVWRRDDRSRRTPASGRSASGSPITTRSPASPSPKITASALRLHDPEPPCAHPPTPQAELDAEARRQHVMALIEENKQRRVRSWLQCEETAQQI